MRPKRTRSAITTLLKSVVALLSLASASPVDAQTVQTLCAFNFTNGASPSALTLGNDGNFYGTTGYSGITNSTFPYGMGTVFQVTPYGSLNALVSFNSTNGANPGASLTHGNDGNFYGTTRNGGSSGFGTVFEVSTNGTLTTLYSFTGATNGNPIGLTQGTDGNFYGTTLGGAVTTSTYPAGMGTVFQLTTNGVLTTLVSFNSSNGVYPFAALTQGNDGNFYGTTRQGGNYSPSMDGGGTVFRITTNGTLTTLVYFTGSNGFYPASGLTIGSDGNLYGTTLFGGNTSLFGNGWGTVFKITQNGNLTMLYSFTGEEDGGNPVANLTRANDGNFYGTTDYNGAGTLFRITTNGTLTTLFSFFTNGLPNVANPNTLTLGIDGNFYSTTRYGGITNSLNPNGMGTVFRLLLPPLSPFNRRR